MKTDGGVVCKYASIFSHHTQSATGHCSNSKHKSTIKQNPHWHNMTVCRWTECSVDSWGFVKNDPMQEIIDAFLVVVEHDNTQLSCVAVQNIYQYFEWMYIRRVLISLDNIIPWMHCAGERKIWLCESALLAVCLWLTTVLEPKLPCRPKSTFHIDHHCKRDMV